MTANDYIIQATTRNAIFLQRLAGGESKKVLRVLTSLEREIAGILATATEGDFNSGQVLANVELATKSNFEKIAAMTAESAQETAAYYSAFSTRMLNRAAKATFKEPDPSKIAMDVYTSAIDFTPNGSPISLKETIDSYGEKKARAFNQIVSDGISSGATNQEMIKSVSETMKLSRRQADTLVRTVTNSAAQTGRASTFTENAEYLEGLEDVAVLDSRTSDYCKSIDGRVRPLSEITTRPPYHFNCRTQLVPKLIKKYSDDKKAPEPKNYGEWLKDQPESIQNEALGKTRAELFRTGEISVKGFVDPTGKTYTLKELRNLEPLAFEKAGLNQ